ncbi:gluconate 2-dehydrogenase subunit 3 family protein [Chryseolinea sp. T2]|uniref:gluconate 2-dehydrogenase subunit 3 family protein n=1 Tax=Chryseolinea sp. T2 TaxID=3129255 RepID=UPI003077C374
MINRRNALKQLGLLTAGVALLPGCVKDAPKTASITLKNIHVSGSQEATLAEIAETLIPTTDIPGAKAMNAHQFVLRMIDDCQPQETQKDFEKGFAEFEEAVEKKHGKSFEELTPADRKSFLTEIDATAKAEREKDNLSSVSKFYSLVRRYTIQGFTSSEYVLTNVFHYNMIPGKFVGCVPIQDKNDVKTVMG